MQKEEIKRDSGRVGEILAYLNTYTINGVVNPLCGGKKRGNSSYTKSLHVLMKAIAP